MSALLQIFWGGNQSPASVGPFDSLRDRSEFAHSWLSVHALSINQVVTNCFEFAYGPAEPVTQSIGATNWYCGAEAPNSLSRSGASGRSTILPVLANAAARVESDVHWNHVLSQRMTFRVWV